MKKGYRDDGMMEILRWWLGRTAVWQRIHKGFNKDVSGIIGQIYEDALAI